MPLRIAHLSHNDRKGGGPLACYRLHRALLDLGTESRMLVLQRHQDDDTVTNVDAGALTTPAHVADRILRRLYLQSMKDRIWSPGRFGIAGLDRHPLVRGSDVLGLYWINGGFLSVAGIDRLLRLNKPVVWRLSDLWPMTGGCHHPGSCMRFEKACGRCPQLGSGRLNDLSARQLRGKQRWRKGELTIVTPSRWLADLAGRSALFRETRIEHITTGIDLDVFRPRTGEEARNQLGLPIDRRLILCGANNAVGNARKGFSHLIEALKSLTERDRTPSFDLVLFGSDETPALPLDLRLHDRGVIDDEGEKALLFAAADLFVTPSLEENLPNTVIEAMAAGTPAVAFDVGGTRELIEHGANGYLATTGDSADLARGIETVLDAASTGPALGKRARDAMAAGHDQRMVAKRYLDLYSELYAERLAASS